MAWGFHKEISEENKDLIIGVRRNKSFIGVALSSCLLSVIDYICVGFCTFARHSDVGEDTPRIVHWHIVKTVQVVREGTVDRNVADGEDL